jgi:hypothetical protein
VPVQDQVEELKQLLDEVAIQIWQPVKVNSEFVCFADIVLPHQKLSMRDARSARFSPSVMIESLESAIRAEAQSMLDYSMLVAWETQLVCLGSSPC